VLREREIHHQATAVVIQPSESPFVESTVLLFRT